ncbi:hypothetical protein LINPERPRIM_LOCUS24181 [Linum perenne]
MHTRIRIRIPSNGWLGMTGFMASTTRIVKKKSLLDGTDPYTLG